MGYVTEPKGIDFIVTPTVLTIADTDIIRHFIITCKSKAMNYATERHVIASTLYTANDNNKIKINSNNII